MIKASFEIPTAHIMTLKEHQDYDFTLAHLALSSELYRRSYGEGNVMDNGQYELEEPLKMDDLRRAAKLIKPRVVISPDFWGEPIQLTLEAHKIATQILDCEVAGVVVGETVEEMEECYRKYKTLGTEIICWPFRKDRLTVLKALQVKGDLDPDKWNHFLGFKGLEELTELKKFGFEFASIDTSEPVKAAVFDYPVFENRKVGKLDHEMIMTKEQLERARFNMDRFREECS